jgi:hypothetical protein
MQVFQLEHFMVASHKQSVPAPWRCSKIQQTLRLSQPMLQREESTLMESHLLYMLTFHKITKITSTVPAAQRVQVNQVQ